MVYICVKIFKKTQDPTDGHAAEPNGEGSSLTASRPEMSHSSPPSFSRSLSFVRDDPPPPPSALLTRADLSNDSRNAHHSNDEESVQSGTYFFLFFCNISSVDNIGDVLYYSEDCIEASGPVNGDVSNRRNLVRNVVSSSPLVKHGVSNTLNSSPVRSVFNRVDDDDDYSSQGQPSSVGGGGYKGMR